MLNYVTLTGTYPDGAGGFLTGGVVFMQSASLVDITDDEIFRIEPITVLLDDNGHFSISLLATDNAALAPSGWGWTIIERVGQTPANEWTFFLEFANGPVQDIADLAPVEDVTTMAAFLPIQYQQGAVAGYVWTTDDAGNGSWQPSSGGGGGGMVNPMTKLGDMIFESAVPAPARLAGNTTATRKFLRSVGDGTNSTAPAWDTLQAGDVPALPYVPTSSLPLAIGNGGTGQTTRQAALDVLAGAVTSGLVLRGDGTHVSLSALQAGDIPALPYDAQGAAATAQANAEAAGLAKSANLSDLASAVTARTNLGLGTAATHAATDFDAAGAAAAAQTAAENFASATFVALASLPLAIGSGGTGQTTRQAALDALAGTQAAGDYLRSDGTHTTLSAIQAGDVPTLNQPTTSKSGSTDALNTTGAAVNVAAAAPPSGGQVLTAVDATHATWQPASSGFANPMTTHGDLIFENATPAPARLAGNTATTRKFLRQTGTGTVANDPAWDTLTAADIPDLSASYDLAGAAATAQANAEAFANATFVTLASLPLSIPNGGTGQTTQQAALDAIAGAVTAGRVLRGDGTHVSLAAIQSGDLPTGTTSAKGALQLDGTGTDIQPLGTQAAGTSGKAADAGHVHPTTGVVTGVTATDASIVVGGTSQAPTIATGTLDNIAAQHPPAANWSNNSKKITSLANGSAASDAAAFGQIPTTLPPSGSAGGALSGSYPNPGFGSGAMGAFLAPKVTTLTFVAAGTTLVDASLGNVFALTLTASTSTLGNPSNPVDGQKITVRMIQDATGSRTIAFGTAYDFGAAGAPTLSTAANKVDILGFEYVASLSKWCYLGAGLGF